MRGGRGEREEGEGRGKRREGGERGKGREGEGREMRYKREEERGTG